MRSKTHSGFTLIELSIVLVVVALIIGGIIVGKELIEVAKIRGQISQLHKFAAATKTFDMKYDYLPGDVPTTLATQLGLPWSGPWTGGFDPRGNGQLDGSSGSAATPRSGTPESVTYFPQLSAAGLIDGNYTWGGPQQVGVHFPATILNAEYGLFPASSPEFDGSVWLLLCWASGTTGNLWMWHYCQRSTDPTPARVMTPLQAFSLDSKLDNGIPSSGMVRAIIPATSGIDLRNDSTAGECVTNASGSAYNVTDSGLHCRIGVRIH